MVFYKFDKYDKYFVAFVLVILVIFNIGQCFAVEEEDVEYSIVQGIWSNQNQNYFSVNNDIRQGYVELEKGYIYTFHNRASSDSSFCFCNDTPAINVVYYNYNSISGGTDYSFVVNDDFNYLVFSVNNPNTNRILTRHKIASQETAVGDLVDNVGFNQLWGVFESGIDFVGVVVLVAFGLFLIVLLIKKLSKGKSDF